MFQKRDMGHPFSYELLRMIAAEERECFPTQTANARFGWGTCFPMSQKRDMGHAFSYELLRMIAAEERECFPTQTANARFGWGTHFLTSCSG